MAHTRIDRSRTSEAKARSMSLRRQRREKSAVLFMLLAFAPVGLEEY